MTYGPSSSEYIDWSLMEIFFFFEKSVFAGAYFCNVAVCVTLTVEKPFNGRNAQQKFEKNALD